MSGGRAAIVMSTAEIDTFIRGRRICVLVTVRPDGRVVLWDHRKSGG